MTSKMLEMYSQTESQTFSDYPPPTGEMTRNSCMDAAIDVAPRHSATSNVVAPLDFPCSLRAAARELGCSDVQLGRYRDAMADQGVLVCDDNGRLTASGFDVIQDWIAVKGEMPLEQFAASRRPAPTAAESALAVIEGDLIEDDRRQSQLARLAAADELLASFSAAMAGRHARQEAIDELLDAAARARGRERGVRLALIEASEIAATRDAAISQLLDGELAPGK